MGMGLPRRFASWIAARSSQSSSWSSRYRMAFGKSLGRAVRREGHPCTAADGPVEAAANFPAENRSGSLVESRAIAKIIHRGRNVTDATFLAHSQIKARDAIKKDPGQSTHPRSTKLLPQLRLLAGRQGVGGWVPPNRPSGTQLGLLRLRHKLHPG
jgi:hypothetical protein